MISMEIRSRDFSFYMNPFSINIQKLTMLMVFTAVMLTGCKEKPSPQPSLSSHAAHTFSGRAMGTSWSVVVPDTGDLKLQAVQSEIAGLLEEIEAKLSHWRDASEVSRFNKASAKTDVPVSRETAELVVFGEKVRKASGGAFDIRVAKEVAARGFGPRTLDRKDREDARVSEIRVQMDTKKETASLVKDEAGTTIDLSAYVKGYGVDRIGVLLDKKGVANYLIEVGGELKARGVNKKGKPWTVGVEVPKPHVSSLHLAVQLENEAIATSGNYRLFRKTPSGEIRSHLVDPRDHGSLEVVFRSVSVIHRDAMAADAWATALFVLDEKEGLQLAEKQGLPVCFLRLDPNGKVVSRTTSGFDERLIP
jgi:thiamine biosynthesis lipoprotein